ncbi:hypothetical protein GGS20DRAFT_497687 [Poronia punctata]|nr:hypothetical protein GGS20DRAFT_497687 [Poronia punctata]
MLDIITDTHGINLPSRYVIRRLDMSVLDWVTAMGIDGFMLRNPSLWKPLLPFPKTATALQGLSKLSAHYAQAISSGMSFGIFDTAYLFKHPSAAAANPSSMLSWRDLDPGQTSFERHGADQMRDAMDFPLVCIALSVDAFITPDPRATRDMYELIPLQQQLNAFLSSVPENYGGVGKVRGKRKSSAAQPPTGYGQVLVRSGCVTRVGYEGQGLATALNRFVLLEAKAWGYRGLRVRLSSPSVMRSYSESPAGWKMEVVAHWDFEDIEMRDEDGVVVRPYLGSGMKDGWELWCDLVG